MQFHILPFRATSEIHLMPCIPPAALHLFKLFRGLCKGPAASMSISLKVQDPVLPILTSAPIKQIVSSQGALLQYVFPFIEAPGTPPCNIMSPWLNTVPPNPLFSSVAFPNGLKMDQSRRFLPNLIHLRRLKTSIQSKARLWRSPELWLLHDRRIQAGVEQDTDTCLCPQPPNRTVLIHARISITHLWGWNILSLCTGFNWGIYLFLFQRKKKWFTSELVQKNKLWILCNYGAGSRLRRTSAQTFLVWSPAVAIAQTHTANANILHFSFPRLASFDKNLSTWRWAAWFSFYS